MNYLGSMMPRLRWYWHRWLAMSPAEVGFRAWQGVLVVRDYYMHLRRSAATPLASILRGPTAAALDSLIGETPRPFLPLLRDARLQRALRPLLEPVIRGTIFEADRVLAGGWSVFGNPARVEADPDWHFDPVLGKRWPKHFYARVDYRAGGAKYIWEPSRHQQAAGLARAYVWTGNTRYAKHACGLVGSWIRANRPYVGVHWTSPFECAVRLLSWSVIFHATRAAEVWSEAELGDLLASLVAQARFVEAHPSRFSSANNHAIGEAAGLACVGLAFPELRDAERWRRVGLRRLEREFARQVLPDGVGAEQAPYYLACVLDYGMFVIALARERGVEVPSVIRDRIAVGARFLERLSAGTSRTPAIGDADDGRAIPLDAPSVDVYDAARIAACAICGDPRLKRPADPVLERLYWLTGAEGAERFAALSPGAPPAASEAFPEGGYAIVVREPEKDRAIMDLGPLGYLSLAAHGHADALAVLLDVNGGPLLVDPGTYVYHEDPSWRNYFRGTRAHNTVTVAGQHQSEILGSTLWGRRAKVYTELQSLGGRAQLIVARHDGYHRLRPAVTHRRALLTVREGYWLVVDWINGDRVPSVELNWHLVDSAVVRRDSPGRWCLEPGGKKEFWVVMCASVPLKARVVCGEFTPPHGWMSERYGERHPTRVLTASAAPSLGAVLVTVISAGRWDLEIASHSSRHAVLELRYARTRDLVILAPGVDHGSLVWGDVSLEGLAALVRFDESSALTGYAVWKARTLVRGNDPIWTAPGADFGDSQEGFMAAKDPINQRGPEETHGGTS